MGQKPSRLTNGNKVRIPLSWLLKPRRTRNPNPEQPIKFQYKTRRKHIENPQNDSSTFSNNLTTDIINKPNRDIKGINSANNVNNDITKTTNRTTLNIIKNTNVSGESRFKIAKTQNSATWRAKSEPNLLGEYQGRRSKQKYQSKKSNEWNEEERAKQFGYEIEDIDEFLMKASIDKPANIPVVLAFPSILYQTSTGYQAEISLPLGMVVNAIFKNQHWLYVQTPHAEEGYVTYSACLPLGIIPPPESNSSPCWEDTTDVFPKPCGNLTDTEKLSSKSECSASHCRTKRPRNAASACGERSVDRLYLRAAASAKSKGTRQTLLVITTDYEGYEDNALSVLKGEVVALVSSHLRGWFWVRNKLGVEGFIPAVVAGHGFL